MRRVYVAAICASCVFLMGCSAIGSSDYVEAGMTDIKDGEYATAIDTFEEAIEEGADKRQCYRGIGISFYEQGMFEEAIDSFKTSLSYSIGIIDDMDFDINFYIAKCYMKLYEYDKAINVYNAILNLDNENADAIYLRAIAYLEKGDFDNAMTDFERVVALDGDDYDRIISIYEYLSSYGYETEGKEILEGIVDEDKMTNYELGRVAFYLGNNAEAQNYLELAKSEKSEEDKESIILLLGQTGEKQGDYNYAMSVYKTYLEENTSAKVYNRLGICELEMATDSNDTSYIDQAIADFEAGIALGDTTENKSLLRNEITAYERKGDFATANTLMESYLQTYPDDVEAQREAVFISTRI